MTGITRQQAAEAVATLFSTTARQTHESQIYDPWEVTDNEGKTWRFVSDNSIRVTHRSGRRQLFTSDDIYKVEMNSPKLEYSEMGRLQDVASKMPFPSCIPKRTSYSKLSMSTKYYSISDLERKL